jgi:iron complex outermembrane receptor protein
LPWDSSAYYADADENVFTRATAWGLMAQYEQDLDFATLSLQYGHRDLQTHAVGRMGGTTIIYIPPTNTTQLIQIPRFPGIDSYVPGNSDQIEIRLLSDTSAAEGDTWEWVVGANILSDKRTEVVVSNFVNFDARLDAQTKALFGQATWTPIERWHLTGGYRYSWDEKTMKSSTVEEYPNKDWPSTPVNAATAEWGEPSYKLNLSFDVTDDVMTYLQYARGQKVGNMETNRVALPSEIMDAFEWGLKSRFLDDRVQLNVDAYYYHYKNYNQWYNGGWCISDADGDHFCDDANGDGVVNNFDMDPYYTGSVSPGDSKSKGISIAGQWLITPKDRVRANIRWQDSKYKTFDLAGAVLALHPGMDTYLQPGQTDQSGREFGDPPIRGNVGYTHTFNIGDTGTLEVTGDLYYEGDGIDQIMFMGEPNEFAMPGREAYWLGDITARYSSTYGMPSGMMWHVRVWCNNVWDSTDLSARDFAISIRGQGAVFPPGSGVVSGTYVLPRTMGVAVGANW